VNQSAAEAQPSTSTANTTGSMSTYTNSTNGFSIQYPSTWDLAPKISVIANVSDALEGSFSYYGVNT
jgi:hypothetical protein